MEKNEDIKTPITLRDCLKTKVLFNTSNGKEYKPKSIQQCIREMEILIVELKKNKKT